MRRWIWAIVLGLSPSAAVAGDLTVALRSPSGSPVSNAVVSFKPSSGGSAPLRIDGPYRMRQVDIQFDPFILIVPVGAKVAFPNEDRVRHHVYSFSIAKRFEIRLYGRDETRSIVFDHPGVVALGCNIHDRMMGFIAVVDTPYVAKVGKSGEVLLSNLPPGGGVLTVWQPFMKTPGNSVTRQITVPTQGNTRSDLVLDLRGPPEDKKPLLE